MATSANSITPADLRGSDRLRRKETAIRWVFLGMGLVSIAISVAIVVSLVGRAVGFLTQIHLGWLFTHDWSPRRNDFSIAALFAASFIVAGIAMLVAAPLGLGSAIYLSEYATPRVRRRLKPIVELLAGVPSIVVGFFALTVISPDLIQRVFASAGIFTLAAAGIGVGIVTIPLVATISEDAMHAVPHAMREASFGLGARRMATSVRIVIPAAVSGIVAAMIVGLSRALGETMVVAIAAGGVGSSAFTLSPLDPGQTATGAMASLATGTDQVAGSGAAFPSLFFVGLLLFVLTFILNVVSERVVRRYRRQY
jgi:phosphate transport system permease protein